MCWLQARTSALGTVIEPMIFSPLEWRYCMSLLSGPGELCFWLQTSATLTLMQHSLECLTVVPSPQVLSLNHTAISSENLWCCCYWVSQSCPTLCDPMDCSTPGFSSLSPGACSNSSPSSQWCHPTISSSVLPFSLAFSLSQHQGLFQWVGCSHQVA